MDAILTDFAKAFETLNAELIIKHLASEFQYDSQWVFASLNHDEYVDYLRGKFETMRRNESNLKVDIVHDPWIGGKMLRLNQKGEISFYRIRTTDGKVTKGDLCMF